MVLECGGQTAFRDSRLAPAPVRRIRVANSGCIATLVTSAASAGGSMLPVPESAPAPRLSEQRLRPIDSERPAHRGASSSRSGALLRNARPVERFEEELGL